MRHQKTRHKLSRDAAHRKSLLQNLCKEVIQHERIKTSEAKAKAVKPELEELITLAKRGDLHARRQALSALGHDWAFDAEGRVVTWACARCGAEGGRKTYGSEAEAQRLAAAFDRRPRGPGAVLAALGGRVDRPPRRR